MLTVWQEEVCALSQSLYKQLGEVTRTIPILQEKETEAQGGSTTYSELHGEEWKRQGPNPTVQPWKLCSLTLPPAQRKRR